MEKNLVYTTCGTCSKLLDVTVENDRVKRVQFIGRLPRELAGHRRTDRRHGGGRSDRPPERHRLRRQGHLLPRPVGEGADAVEKQPVAAENPPSVRRAAR